MAAKAKKPRVFEKKLKLNRVYPDDLQSFLVDNVIIQQQPDRFVLSFFEVWLPTILSESEDETQEQIRSLQEVTAKCVARLVVTPDRMREFVSAIQNSLEKHDQLMESLHSEKE